MQPRLLCYSPQRRPTALHARPYQIVFQRLHCQPRLRSHRPARYRLCQKRSHSAEPGRQPLARCRQPRPSRDSQRQPAQQQGRGGSSGATTPARQGSPKGERGGANQYKAENIFWVPPAVRWSYLQVHAGRHEQDGRRGHTEEPKPRITPCPDHERTPAPSQLIAPPRCAP